MSSWVDGKIYSARSSIDLESWNLPVQALHVVDFFFSVNSFSAIGISSSFICLMVEPTQRIISRANTTTSTEFRFWFFPLYMQKSCDVWCECVLLRCEDNKLRKCPNVFAFLWSYQVQICESLFKPESLPALNYTLSARWKKNLTNNNIYSPDNNVRFFFVLISGFSSIDFKASTSVVGVPTVSVFNSLC